MSMLPTVEFCGLNTTRLIIGANPFGGYSHQNQARDAEMVAYYTPERIHETWLRAEAAGINTMVANNETPHVLQAVKAYISGRGRLQWIAQINNNNFPDLRDAIDQAVGIGCKALFIHGGAVDRLFTEGDAATLRTWVTHGQSLGIPVGVAGHSPAAHDWVDSLELVDFHVVCFFNCGSLHSGKGHRFKLADMFAAAACVRRLQKPCMAYKILGAGRIDPTLGFEFAFENIKPGDVVNVGMHRGDNDNMVEENAALVAKILAA